MGTTGTTAQAIGQGDQTETWAILWRNGILAVGLGLGLVLLQVPIRILGFSLLSGSGAVEQAGQDYYNALIWAAPATLLNFVLLG